jgi:RNA polymerase sigma-70 factor, ECF subfamily
MTKDALGQRIWENQKNLMRFALSIVHNGADAEDAVSDAVVRAMTDVGSLRSDDKLRQWLFSITAHCCYDLVRRKKREEATDDMGRFDTPVFTTPLEGTVYDHITRLKPVFREVLVLFYYEGFLAKEIAQVLGIPLSTVLMRLSRGRQKLKEMYEAEGSEYYDKQTV